jgi:hypothetical protein
MATPPPSRFLAVLYFSLAIFSCGKKTAEVDNESQSIVDNSVCTAEFIDLARTAFEHAKAYIAGGGPLTREYGDSLWMSPAHQPLGLLMAASTYSADKVSRSGLVRIRIPANPLVPGNSMTLRLSSYHARKLHFGCDSIMITCTTYSPNFFELKVKVSGGQLFGGHDDPPAHFAADCLVSESPLFAGAIIINGTTEGTSRGGLYYDSRVTSSLFKWRDCNSISAGVLDHHPKGLKPREVHYGTGYANACDNEVLFAVNGNSIAVKTE